MARVRKKRPGKRIVTRRDVAALMARKEPPAGELSVAKHLEAPDLVMRRAAIWVVLDAREREEAASRAMADVTELAMGRLREMLQSDDRRLHGRAMRALANLSAHQLKRRELDVRLAVAAMMAAPEEIAAEAQVRLMGELVRGAQEDGMTPEGMAAANAVPPEPAVTPPPCQPSTKPPPSA